MPSNHLALRVIRLFLAIVFIAYGTVKLLGGQFIYSDWTISRSTASGPSLVWAFYGFSPIYARFIALCELVPAVLLLFPRTAFLGAAALFPVVLNITVLDFTYGFPSVKYMALLYTVLCGGLLWVEREKLLFFLQPIDRVRAALTATASISLPPTATPRPIGTPLRALLVVLGVALSLFFANLVAESASDGPEAKALAAVVEQTGTADWSLRRSRYYGLFAIGRTAVVEYQRPDSSRVTVHASRAVGFVPWRVDSVVRGGAAR